MGILCLYKMLQGNIQGGSLVIIKSWDAFPLVYRLEFSSARGDACKTRVSCWKWS